MIYLASPYSHPDEYIKIRRFEAAARAAAKLMCQGHIVFSPIAMTHPMAIYGVLPGDWQFWARFDQVFIKLCEELWVLQLQGWRESKGVIAEIKIAETLGLPIRYVTCGELDVADVPYNNPSPFVERTGL